MNSNAVEMLSGLLGNPDAVKTAVDMIGSLSAPTEEKQNASAVPQNEAPQIKPEVPDISFLANLLSENKVSLQAMTRMKKAYDAFSNAHDPSINLINALSPYLSTRRAMNAEKLITAVKVSKAINVFREE